MRPSFPTLALAAVCYLVALAGCAAFSMFVLAQGLGAWPNGLTLTLPVPWACNVGWLFLFAVQHSGMARERYKRWAARYVPRHLGRLVYAALAGLLLLALPLLWQPVPGTPFWEVSPAFVVVPLAAALVLALINLRYDHLGLFGVRQALWGDAPEPPETLLVTGPYRYVRHPLMACLLLFLWAQPVMSTTLALLAAGLSAYILVGTVLEERDLLDRFGPAYNDYRRAVPRLVPWKGPAHLRGANESAASRRPGGLL